MLKVMFVCEGNTCRSPMAEYALKHALKSAGVDGVKVTSAGLSAREADSMNEKAKLALKKRGVVVRRFGSKRVSAELAAKQNAVICMTKAQKQAFLGFNNVYCISELADVNDVADPYGGSQEVYDQTLNAIFYACEQITELLKSENEKLAELKAKKEQEKLEKAAKKQGKLS